MAHECPDCGKSCNCEDGERDIDLCEHWIQEDCDDPYEDDDEDEDEKWRGGAGGFDDEDEP